MKLNPINKNNELSENHWLVVGPSGSGKTTAVKQLGMVSKGDQVAIFDPYLDYDNLCGAEIRRYVSISKFASALFSARAAKESRGFKIAFSPLEGANPESLEAFCRVVWGAGNGEHKKPLKVVLEELAKCVTTSGTARGAFGEILTGGRKFGLEAVCLFQRGQEVPKTITGNCANQWVGRQKRANDAVYLSKELDFPVEEIKALQRYCYLIKRNDHGIGEFEQGKLRKL